MCSKRSYCDNVPPSHEANKKILEKVLNEAETETIKQLKRSLNTFLNQIERACKRYKQNAIKISANSSSNQNISRMDDKEIDEKRKVCDDEQKPMKSESDDEDIVILPPLKKRRVVPNNLI